MNLPESDVNVIVFTLVKSIGYFCKSGFNVIVDIRLPNDMFLLVSPDKYSILAKTQIQSMFTPLEKQIQSGM